MKANDNSNRATPTLVKRFREGANAQVGCSVNGYGARLVGRELRTGAHRLGLAAAVALLAVAVLASCKGSGSSDVAARVGSHEIKMEQINMTINQQMDNGSGKQPSNAAELAALQLGVLDNLIQAEVLLQKAQRENVSPDDAKVSQEIEKQKQDARLTEDEYQKKLKQMGMTEASLREQVKTQLAINALH